MKVFLYIALLIAATVASDGAGRMAVLDSEGSRHSIRTIGINGFEYGRLNSIEEAFGGGVELTTAASSFFVAAEFTGGEMIIIQMSRPSIDYRGSICLPVRSFYTAFAVAAGEKIEITKNIIKFTGKITDKKKNTARKKDITREKSLAEKESSNKSLKRLKEDHFRRAFLRTAEYLNNSISSVKPTRIHKEVYNNQDKKPEKDYTPEKQEIPANVYIIPKNLIRRELQSSDSR